MGDQSEEVLRGMRGGSVGDQIRQTAASFLKWVGAPNLASHVWPQTAVAVKHEEPKKDVALGQGNQTKQKPGQMAYKP